MKKLASVALLMLLSLGAAPELHYVSPDAVMMQSLPEPAARGSAEEAAELRSVLALQAARTSEQIEDAKKYDKISVFQFAEFGEKFTAQNCPKTAAFFKNVEADGKYFVKVGKNYFSRPRPPVLSGEVKPLFDEPEPGYPSGHATRGELFAQILATMFPEKKEALIHRGQEIGYLRLVAGVHFESDICAGRMLAKELVAQMQKNEQFVKDMNEAKEEIAALAGK